MLGLISSTIFPSNAPLYWGSSRACIPNSERLEQTRRTVASLQEAGFSPIILADNSGTNWVAGTEESLAPAEVHVFRQHQFQNKGISEIYTLLDTLNFLTGNTPILKISGRYYLTEDVDHQIGADDIVAKVNKHGGVKSWMSTRCYLIKDVAVLEAFLRAVLRDLYGYGARVVGPRSLFRILRHSLSPDRQHYPYDDPVSPIEVPAARVVESGDFRVRLVSTLGIEGTSADRDQRLIRE